MKEFRPWTEARLYGLAQAVARAYVRDADDREDATMVAWARGAEVAATDPCASPVLVTIAMRQRVFTFCEKELRRSLVGRPVPVWGRDRGVSTDDGRLLVEWLREVLPPLYYEALRLRYEGYTDSEVAALHGIEVVTARTRFNRARKAAAALILGEVSA